MSKREMILIGRSFEIITSEDCWIVIDNNVYVYPGTPVPIEFKAGKDVTKPFKDVKHSDHAKSLLPKYLMRTIKEGDIPTPNKLNHNLV